MKKRLTRFLPFLLAFTIALPSYSVFAEEENQAKETQTNETNETQADETTANDTLSLAAETAVLIDAASGEILYDKDADKKMYPASITKLMTILLALENGKLTDEITFSHDAVYNIEPGSAHIAILEGETLTLEQVLRAIILRSANEASNGVAEYVDGSVEAFAKHMTERAKELGCTNTNFVNANGLFDENHYTTAHDMALIARELLKHEEYRSMMSETDYEIPPTNLQTETRYLHGQHQMLNPNSIYYYKDAIGGKTGYTVEAGNTLVTYAERDGLTLIAVVMKCNGAEHYTDTAALFDYGFANYASVKIAAVSDYTSTVPVTETYNKKTVDLGKVTIAPSEDVYYTLPKGTDASAVTVKTDIPEGVEGTVKKGQTLGTLQLSYNGKTQTVDLIAQNAVDALTDTQKAELDKSSLSGMVKRVALGVGIAAIVLLLIFCI
ncbi:serine hydrolase, partial [Anaerotignum faecicola]